jgi:predicted RecA/RadA family phage recombinase
MAKGKIVLEGVFGIQAPKLTGNIEGHRPAGAFSIGQSDVTGDSRDMGVQWNDQTFRREPVPYAAIDSIVRANHPSEK